MHHEPQPGMIKVRIVNKFLYALRILVDALSPQGVIPGGAHIGVFIVVNEPGLYEL